MGLHHLGGFKELRMAVVAVVVTTSNAQERSSMLHLLAMALRDKLRGGEREFDRQVERRREFERQVEKDQEGRESRVF